jgi:hypothetical protein
MSGDHKNSTEPDKSRGNGVVERWNTGVLDVFFITPSLLYSNTPNLPESGTALFKLIEL